MEERLCSHKHGFGISAEWISDLCDDIGGADKCHVAKQSLQRFLNNQILDYKAILDLCENEMMSINLFGICQRAWSVLKSLKLGNDMKVGRLSLSHGVVTI